MNDQEDQVFSEEEIRLMAALGITIGVFTLPQAALVLGRSKDDVRALVKLGMLRRLGGPFCTIHFFAPYILEKAKCPKFAAQSELQLNRYWADFNARKREKAHLMN